MKAHHSGFLLLFQPGFEMNLLFLQDADPQLCLLQLPLELHDLHQ